MKVKHLLTYSATLTNRLAYGMVVAILCFVFQLYPSLGKSQTLYWAESITNSIKKANIASPPVTDGSATALATPSIPLYMFEDNRNGYVYWSDAGSGSIKKVSTAGGAVTTVLTGITGAGVYPRGIYVDVTNNVLYWAQTGSGKTDVVEKVSISGALPVASSSGTTIASAIDIVRGITVDTLAGNVYFADAGVSGSGQGIYRASSSGSTTEAASVKVASLSSAEPNSLFIDNTNNFVYWSDFLATGGIKRAGISGSLPATPVTVYSGASVRGISIDPGTNTIYWTQYPSLTIQKASLVTIPIVSSTSVVNSLAGFPRSVAIPSTFTIAAPSSLSYTGSPYVYTKGATITPLTPTVTGTVSTWGISPALPTGLLFNTTTGVISGTPTALSTQTTYTVTATNSGGNTTTTIQITVNDFAPTSLSYTGSPFVYTKNSAITPVSPSSSGGTVVSYGISPALPTGLLFNTTTGSISGTPTALSSQTTYTVTATNSGGNTTTTIQITVKDVAPSLLSYAGSPFVYTINTAIAPLTPSISGGAVVSYGISPALPTGLLFNTSTGVISGTPTAISSQTTYTITATNSGGNTQTTIQVAVKDVAPSSLSYAGSPFVYTKNSPITPVSPSSSGGTVVSYGISPALPAGLLFNTTTGVISGTPTALSTQTTYTVTATNSGGFTTANIQVTVTDAAPSSLSYTGSPFVYTVNMAIAPLTPSISGGAVVSYGISPALPTGLMFSTTTGVISGTPTVVSPATSYTVTATNTGGTANTTINIKVDGIASFTPTSATPGTVVTIKGDGFTGATAVSFGGRPATSFTVASDSVITAVVAKGSTGVVQVNAPAGIFSMAGFTFCGIYVTPYVNIVTATYPVICQGTNVVLTAHPSYGGNAPAYQWYKNSSPVGSNSVTYTDNTLQTGDAIMVTMTSNVACATMPTATSNIAKFTVTPLITPSVSLANLGSDTICKGQKVLLIARKANVGTGNGVSYQWVKNGAAFGPVTTNPLYTDSLLQNGDQLKVVMTTPAACVTTNTAVSNTLVITVNQPMITAPVIAGPTNVTPGQAGVVFTTAANPGVQYTWAVSSGVAITMGQNTDTLTVNWGNTSGMVRLKETNACGSSPIATAKVTVTPGVIAQFGKYVPGSEKINMVLYPNPVQNETQLDLKGFTGNVVVTVANMAGNIVWQREKLTNATYTLQLGNLPSGLYVVTAKDGSKTKSITIVKAK